LRRPLILFVALIALVAASCGGSSTPLATVNDVAITPEDLAELDPAYEDVDPSEEAAFMEDLRLAVVLTAIETQAEEDFGVIVTAEEVDAVFDNPTAELEDALANWNALIESGQISQGQAQADARSLLVRRGVSDALIEDSAALEQIWEGTPQVFYTGCVRHILTETEEAAQVALDRIAAGEEFSALAEEVSIDSSTAPDGGLLRDPQSGQCDVPLAVFVTEFGYEAAVATVGVPSEPFSTDFGYHVILVDERSGPESLEDVKADPDAYFTEELRAVIVNPWLSQAIATADIVIDPAIGTWSVAAGDIVPIGADGTQLSNG
jgi:parvulin-like peptidyl-prolyl isomerase